MKGLKKLYANVFGNPNETIHRSIVFVLVIGQIFGLMPINGITSPSEKSLHFTWKSWKIIYSVLLIVGTFFGIIASLYDVIKTEADIDQITAVIFFSNSFAVHVFFIGLAKNWSKLIDEWRLVEMAMHTYGYPQKLNFRLKCLTTVILSTAAVEHFLVVTNHLQRADECKSGSEDIFEYFFVKIAFPQVFAMSKYSFVAGFLMQVVTFASTFSWTYIDLFIMLMSTLLAMRFKQVADRVETYVEGRVSDDLIWRNIREDYCRLSELCKKLNEAISSLVMISFGSNLFFILVQLFHSLKHIEDVLEKIYFFFSFGFLIGRTVCVCLYGAWINDESQRPLHYLNAVPSTVYNIEIRRFILHTCFNSSSLSGKQFFNVTRGLLLSIAGTIMTYELVMIQFYGNVQATTIQTETSLEDT